MGQVADMIVRCATPSVGLAERMLKDIRPEQFARKPVFHTTSGDKVVDTNHPAFVYGHLSIYPERIFGILGLAAAEGAKNPAGLAELVKSGAECRDDPQGAIYPPMAAVTSHFFAAYKSLLAALPAVDDATLAGPNPMEGRMKEMFPTVGAAATFMLTSHVMMHLGQVSAWRRCMGLGPVV